MFLRSSDFIRLPEGHIETEDSVSRAEWAIQTSPLNFGRLFALVLTAFALLWPMSQTFAAGHESQTFEEISDLYTQRVEPILAHRCAVCHGCTEAPCQLKLTSITGLRRGLTQGPLSSLREAFPTRLKDAPDTAAWRQRNFTPVVADEPTANAQQNRADSLLFHAITAGMNNNADTINTGKIRAYFNEDASYCPRSPATYSKFIAERPELGMPMGLPALSPQEYQTLVDWIDGGAQGPGPHAQVARATSRQPFVVAQWESFLNQSSAKDRLIARYIFEHVGAVHFHFKEGPREFFELIRSSTESPETPREIVTETVGNAIDGAFTYRFRKIDEIIVKKNHVVWDVSLADLQNLKQLFHSKEWDVPTDEKPSHSGNPFRDFHAIPPEIRARFMIGNSHMLIDQMVRGTVCLGTNATFAIRDHFWVMFLKPESDPSVQNPTLGLSDFILEDDGLKRLREIPTSLTRNTDYRDAFERQLRRLRPKGLGLDDIWLGDGNANARETIFRHQDIASVHTGWVGGRPLTAWVLSYSNFERLYYNLVANYRYWGSLSHRYNTWQAMRNIRVEGEELFTTMLPPRYRSTVRNTWSRGYPGLQRDADEERSELRGSRIQIMNDDDPVGDLLAQLDALFPRAPEELNDSLNLSLREGDKAPFTLNAESKLPSFAEFEAGLRSLTHRRDRSFPRVLPSVSFLRVRNENTGEMRVYTLVANRAYSSHESPIGQEQLRLKKEDNVSVFPGVVGSHPNIFFDITLASSAAFLNDLYQLRGDGWNAFKDKHAIARSSSRFWPFSDWLNDWYAKFDPVNSGYLDLINYDNGRGHL
jgi:hypothetical protein